MQKRTHFRLAAALAALVAFAPAVQAQDATADTVLATVNGTDITLGHMIALRTRLPEQYQNLPDEVLFTGILDQLIQHVVLSDTTDGLSKGNQLAIDNETRSLLAGQVYQRVASEAVTDDALQAAYEAAFANAEQEEEFDASHILVETQERAAELKAELDAGADFATLARENSVGPSGPNGGALGWFGKGMMVEPFEAAVVTLEVGQVSEPVQTQFGWHVIRLNDKRLKAAPALEEVRDQLVQQIQRDAIESLVAELTSQAQITRVADGEIDPALMRDDNLIAD